MVGVPETMRSQNVSSDSYIQWMLNHGLEDDAALIEFASQGDLQTILLLLENNTKVDTVGSDSQTALMRACIHGHTEIVCTLVDHGANLNLVDSEGLTALMMAATNGNLDAIKYLISSGVNLEIKDKDWGFTALSKAIWNEHWHVADCLLEAGSSPEPKRLHDFRPLSRACWNGKVSAVKWLLDNAKLKIDDKHRYGWNALMQAAAHGKVESVNLLLAAGACTEIRSDFGYTAITIAAMHHQFHVLKILLEAKANINNADGKGHTALMLAADKGNSSIVRICLEHGAYVDVRTNRGYTPLHRASWKGRTEYARILLEHGANPNTQNEDGFSPLTEAVTHGRDGIVDLLLQYKSNPNVVTNWTEDRPKESGRSILMIAVDKNARFVERLLRAGADKTFKSRGGETALSMAKAARRIDLILHIENIGNPKLDSL